MLSEPIGTALLVTVVVGSGIAAHQLSPNDVGLQQLENSIATILGGLLLGAAPATALIPLLVVLLLASAVKVWRHP
jgi:hypothetical protein